MSGKDSGDRAILKPDETIGKGEKDGIREK